MHINCFGTTARELKSHSMYIVQSFTLNKCLSLNYPKLVKFSKIIQLLYKSKLNASLRSSCYMLCGIQTLQSRSAEPPLLFDCDEDEKNPEELEELEDILD